MVLPHFQGESDSTGTHSTETEVSSTIHETADLRNFKLDKEPKALNQGYCLNDGVAPEDGGVEDY
jgi:hypothetical protein